MKRTSKSFLKSSLELKCLVSFGVALAVVIYAVLVVTLRIITRDDLALLPKGEKLARVLRL